MSSGRLKRGAGRSYRKNEEGGVTGMAMTWTKEQEQVITLRDRNILASAAAGSGKTAVLVARILGMVTDPKRPVNM